MPRPLELEKWGLLGGGRGLAKATRNFAILIFTLTHSVVISNNVPDIARKARREGGSLLGLEEGACREGGACREETGYITVCVIFVFQPEHGT
jgi:hypothetical protein